jgi:hypothetical protein
VGKPRRRRGGRVSPLGYESFERRSKLYSADPVVDTGGPAPHPMRTTTSWVLPGGHPISTCEGVAPHLMSALVSMVSPVATRRELCEGAPQGLVELGRPAGQVAVVRPAQAELE